jgi:putative transposase
MNSFAQAHSEGRASARPGSLDRKHPIHLPPLEVHNCSIIVFVTVCTTKRRDILASPSSHDAIIAAWRTAHTWLVGCYVVMPDHIHLFCAPNGLNAPSLERWMRFWKSIATRNLHKKAGTVSQRHHWDRQLRSGESYEDKWNYVRNNPVRHGHVSKADQWAYQGELNELRW